VNGGTYVEHQGGGGIAWFDATAQVTGGVLNTLRIRGSTTTVGQSGINWRAIEVDGVILVDSEPETVLTFASDKDLANFRVDDAIEQQDQSADGIITAIDAVARTLTIKSVTGTWTPGAGNYAVGPDTTPASGIVESHDLNTNSVTLSSSDDSSPKRWIVNQGKTVSTSGVLYGSNFTPHR
jgi:hypothetical protein